MEDDAKMTRVYLIRHGESAANCGEIFTGQMDFPLSERGHRQAELAGEYLKDKGIDVIYASDLIRAYDTAVPTAKKCGLEIIRCPEFRELNGGKWEGLTYDQLLERYPTEYPVFVHDFGNASCEGGESIVGMTGRIRGIFDRIVEENDGKTVAVFTHACPIRELQCVLCGRPTDDMRDIKWVGNASTTLVECDRGKYNFAMIGYNGYLAELATQLPDRV